MLQMSGYVWNTLINVWSHVLTNLELLNNNRKIYVEIKVIISVERIVLTQIFMAHFI